MRQTVQLTYAGMLHSLISATARLHICLRGAIDQDLNLKLQVSDFWPTQRNYKIFDDHAHCEERKIGTVWKLIKKIKEARSSIGRN